MMDGPGGSGALLPKRDDGYGPPPADGSHSRDAVSAAISRLCSGHGGGPLTADAPGALCVAVGVCEDQAQDRTLDE